MQHKVLIIEDDTALAENLAEVLRSSGFAVLTASCGKRGLDLARFERPDIICCDISLGDINGLEILQLAALFPETHNTPFILITGDPETATMRKGMELGAYDYLIKPFRSIDLLRAVQAQITRHKQQEQRLTNLQRNIKLALPHELRTPLTGILGFSEILEGLTEELPLEEIKEMGGLIHSSGMRMLETIERVLLSTQLDIAISELPAAPAPASQTNNPAGVIPTVARETADRYGRAADLRLLTNDSPTLAIPLKFFTRAVHELTDNAFKFSETGTPVEVSGVASAEGYHILVINKIKQIDVELAHIGEDFMQLNRDVHEQQGLGLGLALVKKIARCYAAPFTINLSGKKVSAHLLFGTYDKTAPTIPEH